MMARVEHIERREHQRPHRHGEVRATYSIVNVDGIPHLQIDTYGAADRVIPGKVSQSLQFGPAGIAELRRILGQIG